MMLLGIPNVEEGAPYPQGLSYRRPRPGLLKISYFWGERRGRNHGVKVLISRWSADVKYGVETHERFPMTGERNWAVKQLTLRWDWFQRSLAWMKRHILS